VDVAVAAVQRRRFRGVHGPDDPLRDYRGRAKPVIEFFARDVVMPMWLLIVIATVALAEPVVKWWLR
jgi:hypothetical protein